MAKSRALVAAEQRIAALEARLSVAAETFRNQKQRIAQLEAQLATPGRAAPGCAAPGRAAIQHFGQRTVKRYPAQGAQS